MSVLIQRPRVAVTAERDARSAAAAAQRHVTETERESYRLKLVKVLCAVMIAVCFWFSVPYELPLPVQDDATQAAAQEAQAYQGSHLRQAAMPMIFLLSLYMLWRLPKRGRVGGHLVYLAAGYVMWCAASFAWSEDPAITRKRLVVFAINAFFAFTLARVFSVLEMAALGAAATGVVTVISLYSDVALRHTFAPGNADYRFQGTMQANYQGMSIAVGIYCCLTLLQRKPKWAAWMVPWLVVLCGLLYLTRSRVGTILCLVLAGTMLTRWMRDRMQPAMRATVILAACAVVVPALVFIVGKNGGANTAQTAFTLGRSDTQSTQNLSNRAPLWSELMDSVRERPWVGTGYEAFWTPARVERVSLDQGWAVPHAHNTYLDQALGLGAVGAVLYALMLWAAAGIAWARHRRAQTATSLLPAVLLTWVALTSLAESVPLDPYLPTMLAYACVVKMCLAEGSEQESDAMLGEDEVVGGLHAQPALARQVV